jgi:hypothetical protein
VQLDTEVYGTVVQVEGDVKLEEMDGEENPVDMRNVFPPNTAHNTEKICPTNIFKCAYGHFGLA